MAQVQVASGTPAQLAQLRKSAKELEAYSRSVEGLIGGRAAWWASVINIAGSYDFDLAQVAGAELVALNEAADRSAKKWATCALNLKRGTAELVAHQAGDKLILGVLPKGALPPSMGFPLLVVVVVAGAAALAWLTIDAWSDVRLAQADAEKAYQANEAKRLQLMQLAQASGPQAVSQLSQLFKAADQSAKRPGAFDSLGSGIASIGENIGKAADAGLIILAGVLLWQWSKKRKGKALAA